MESYEEKGNGITSRVRVLEEQVRMNEKIIDQHFKDEEKFQREIRSSLDDNLKRLAESTKNDAILNERVNALVRVGWIVAGAIITAIIGAIGGLIASHHGVKL